jgi:FAD-dependent urate hydroxylase
VGEGKRASLMPVGPDRQYFFFDVPLPLDEVDDDRDVQTQLKGHFEGWAPAVHELIDRLDPAGVARIPIHDHEPLDRMARGRVALLGDSAHATAPDLGQGACQAMEDAMVLANYVTTTTLGVPDALTRYSAERTPHIAEIMRRARQRARLTHNFDPVATAAWYDELKAETGENILAGLAKSVVGGPWR